MPHLRREHSNYARSAHKSADISCVDCHSPHHAKEKNFLLREKQPQLCYGCHLEAKADFTKAFHHRVNEGLVKCTDCHNQHGGFVNRQMPPPPRKMRFVSNANVDKAGPFAFEHGPVRRRVAWVPYAARILQSRLLKRSQVNLLCWSVTLSPPILRRPARRRSTISAEVPGLYAVPYPNSRLEFQATGSSSRADIFMRLRIVFILVLAAVALAAAQDKPAAPAITDPYAGLDWATTTSTRASSLAIGPPARRQWRALQYPSST